MSSPLERYRAQLEQGDIEHDRDQERVLHEFERLFALHQQRRAAPRDF